MIDTSIPILSDLNLISVSVRLVLSCLFGGIIGLERGQKRRPAGFRTYMLVCLGSALAMMTNQYASLLCGIHTDVSRIGAGVISGIGFLGAGTIIVTRNQQVKGLTTAAGIWACASMGLALGVGFYSAAIIGFILIVLSMTLLHNIDNIVYSSSKVMDLYVECQDARYIKEVIKYLRLQNVQVSTMDIIKNKSTIDNSISVIMTVKQATKGTHEKIVDGLTSMEGITFIEEL